MTEEVEVTELGGDRERWDGDWELEWEEVVAVERGGEGEEGGIVMVGVGDKGIGECVCAER